MESGSGLGWPKSHMWDSSPEQLAPLEPENPKGSLIHTEDEKQYFFSTSLWRQPTQSDDLYP